MQEMQDLSLFLTKRVFDKAAANDISLTVHLKDYKRVKYNNTYKYVGRIELNSDRLQYVYYYYFGHNYGKINIFATCSPASHINETEYSSVDELLDEAIKVINSQQQS